MKPISFLRQMGVRRLAAAAAFLLLILTASGALAFTQSSQVTFVLQGCRNDGTITLPIGGKFICPDAAYTTGNLGKGWNELDLVPHRLTTQLGNQTGATTDYNAYIAADNQTNSKIGFDVISAPVVNAGKSDASCTVSAGSQSTKGSSSSPFGGGTDIVIYRELTIHQNQGTTCVFDYYERLAIGSHSYPGSSLQSYTYDQVSLSGGKKTVSLPVNQIQPQSISKDMSATQGSTYPWTVAKVASPTAVSFANTCDTGAQRSASVQITVTWTKATATPSGSATITTHVFATNPSSRVITVNVSDKIYAGSNQSTLLDTASSGDKDVPANTLNFPMLTHTFTWTNPSGTTVNDVATATYIDKVTGIAVPGTTTATATATIQSSGTALNDSAVIGDAESITGSGFQYSADSTSGATGTFGGGYAAGTKTTSGVSWTSASQNATGSVTFNKTIYVNAGTAGTGTLSDTATLTGSNGASSTANLSVGLSAGAKVTLTINKTISSALQGSDTATFTFHVKNGSNVEVAAPTITFTSTDPTTKHVDVSNLDPGTYSVTEDALAGWNTSSTPQSATIALPQCTGSVSFSNTELGHIVVDKVTVPGGSPQLFTFTPSYNSGATFQLADATTPNDSGALAPGSYTVAESAVSGWTLTGLTCTSTGSGSTGARVGTTSSASINLAAGETVTCTFTNTRDTGTLTIAKTATNPDGASLPSFTIDYDCGGSFTGSRAVTAGNSATVTGIPTGSTCTVSEAALTPITDYTWGTPFYTPAPPSVTIADTTSTFTITVANSITRDKGSLVLAKALTGGPASFTGPFTINYSCGTGFINSVTVSAGTSQTVTGIPTGNSCTISEPSLPTPPAGYHFGTATFDPSATVSIPAGSGSSVTVTTNNTLIRDTGALNITKTVNWNGVAADTGKTFQICIQGPSFPNGNEEGACKIAPYNGAVLNWPSLATGSYAVTETAPGSEWNVSVTGSPVSVDMGAGTASASVTNTRKLGSLQVTKTINWNGVAPSGSPSFDICIQGPSYATANCKSFNSTAGLIQTWTNLIPGSYTVTEPSVPAGWAAVVTGSPANVPTDGGQVSASVANTHVPVTITPTPTPTNPPKEPDLFCVQSSNGSWSLKSATKGTPEYDAIINSNHMTPVNGGCPSTPPTPTPVPPTATPVPSTPGPSVAGSAPPPPPTQVPPTPQPAVAGEMPGPIPAQLPYTGEADTESSTGELGGMMAGLAMVAAALLLRRRMAAPVRRKK